MHGSQAAEPGAEARCPDSSYSSLGDLTLLCGCEYLLSTLSSYTFTQLLHIYPVDELAVARVPERCY